MTENNIFMCLVSFLDFKDNNLKDLPCEFNFEHKLNRTDLEILFNVSDNKKMHKDITNMLYERYNMNINSMNIKLTMLNNLGIIINELVFNKVFDGFDYNFDKNTIKLKFGKNDYRNSK